MERDGGAYSRSTIDVWIERLTRAATTGELVDLAPGVQVHPEDAATWSAERTIPAAALRTVLTARDLRVDPHGLRIRAARFTEPLDLVIVDFPHRLRLTYCALTHGLNADSARFLHLDLNHTHASGEVRAVGATITGQLDLTNAVLTNPGGIALALDGANIGGGLIAAELHASGEVRAVGATVSGQLVLTNAVLTNRGGDALALHRASISGDLIAAELHASGVVRAVRATVSGRLDLTNAELTNPDGNALDLDGANIGGGGLFAAELHAFGAVRAVGASISGQLVLTKAELTNPDGTP